MKENRSLVLKNPPFGAFSPLLDRRSEGVRKPFRTVRGIVKVSGIGSLAKFLRLSLRDLGRLLAHFIPGGHVYGRGTLCTWAKPEHKPQSRKWHKQYKMPDAVRRALCAMVRSFVVWASWGVYDADVRVGRVMRVQLRRVA